VNADVITVEGRGRWKDDTASNDDNGDELDELDGSGRRAIGINRERSRGSRADMDAVADEEEEEEEEEENAALTTPTLPSAGHHQERYAKRFRTTPPRMIALPKLLYRSMPAATVI